jgi:hypothetical protein
VEVVVTPLDDLPEFADPAAVHRLLASTTDGWWDESEYASLWRGVAESSLAVCVHEVLGGVAAVQANERCRRLDPPVQTVRDLVQHLSPDVWLLRAVKEMGKTLLYAPHLGLPRPVLLLLYTLPIVLARMRCDARISEMSDEQLTETTQWLSRQPWVDPDTRQQLDRGAAAVSGSL